MAARDWPVCASWREGPSSRCAKTNGSKFLCRKCFDPVNENSPKHYCIGCKKPLHCGLCAFNPESERGEELCLTCVEQTRSVDNTTGQTKPTGGTKRKRTNKHKDSRTSKRTRTSPGKAVPGSPEHRHRQERPLPDPQEHKQQQLPDPLPDPQEHKQQ